MIKGEKSPAFMSPTTLKIQQQITKVSNTTSWPSRTRSSREIIKLGSVVTGVAPRTEKRRHTVKFFRI
jgi:hypothetical protein